MKTPVLISAYNEERHLHATLQALPADTTEPVLLANGCTDATVAIAERFGVPTIELESRGKMPAIQAGIGYLGARAVTEPFILLDADSRPMFPSKWVNALWCARADNIDSTKPAAVVGSFVYSNGASHVSDVVRSAAHAYKHFKSRNQQMGGGFYGRNMLFDLKTQDLRDDIMAMPNYWPGEDRAIKDMVLQHGGLAYKSSDVAGIVITDAERVPSLFARFKMGRQGIAEYYIDTYDQDRPDGAMRYAEENTAVHVSSK